jgi:hypothetical protein
MRKNKSTRRGKQRGQKQQPLEVEVEFIGGEEARKRWDAIFKLLEADEMEPTECSRDQSKGPEHEQLSLF